jgi:hypothetical protein
MIGESINFAAWAFTTAASTQTEQHEAMTLNRNQGILPEVRDQDIAGAPSDGLEHADLTTLARPHAGESVPGEDQERHQRGKQHGAHHASTVSNVRS